MNFLMIVRITKKKVFLINQHILTIITTLPLIIEKSLAPSPIANVTAFFERFINSTTMAFCNGVTRQHITALHCDAISRKLQVE